MSVHTADILYADRLLHDIYMIRARQTTVAEV